MLAVGFGGGVNSTALLLGMYERGIRPSWVTFADTGNEYEETYRFLDVMDAWLDRVGFPRLVRVRRAATRVGRKDLYDECIVNETLPSMAFGFSSCAHKWKIDPQEKFFSMIPEVAARWKSGQRITKALGIDYGEQRRATITQDDRFDYICPLVEWKWDRDLCVEAIKKHGIPVPRKSSCWFCPSSKKREVLALKKDRPDLFALAVVMEKNAAPNLGNVKGLGRNWSWEALGKADEAQLKMFSEAPVESCMICDDGECDAEAA